MSMKSMQERVAGLRPHPINAFGMSLYPFVVAILLAFVIDKVVGPAVGATWSKILLDVGIAILLAGSLNVVNGYAGQFSIGHAGFMLVGGYAAAWLTFYGSIHFFGPEGAVVRVLGQMTARQPKRVTEIQGRSLGELANNLGGAEGFSQIPSYTTLFFVYFFAFILLVLVYRLKYSSQGRALLAVRENEIAAEAMGVDTTRSKVVAFIFGAFFAGIGGSLYAHQVGALDPKELGFLKSIDLVIIVVIGGMGSITGVVIGAAILVILPEVFRS